MRSNGPLVEPCSLIAGATPFHVRQWKPTAERFTSKEATTLAKRTQFVRLLDDVVAAIETDTATGKGQHLRRAPLLRHLLEWVTLLRSPDELLLLRKEFRGRFENMDQRRGQVACAIHAGVKYELTWPRAAKLATVPGARVTADDLRAVERLSKRAGATLQDLDRNAHECVRSVVDAYFERLVVVLDRRALEDMLLAALEAYVVPKPGKGQKYTEVFGYCFGTRRDLPREGLNRRFRRLLAIGRIVTQLRNRASANEVYPSAKSEQVHLNIAASFFEHLTLLGDYHTHPWQSLSKLRRGHGWTPSSADRDHIAGWAANARNAGGSPRFSLIAAVARGGKKGRSAAREAKNRVRFCVGGLYVVLAAYRLQRDGTYDSDIVLLCPGVADVAPKG